MPHITCQWPACHNDWRCAGLVDGRAQLHGRWRNHSEYWHDARAGRIINPFTIFQEGHMSIRRISIVVAALAVLALCVSSVACNQAPTLPSQNSWEQARAPQLAEPAHRGDAALDQAKAEQPSDSTVYTTNTGSKYHLRGCRYLSQSKHKTTVCKALANRYKPCSVCRPPKKCT